MFGGQGASGATSPQFPQPSGTVFTARLTAAAAVNLPASGYVLTKVKLITGATPGAFSVAFNGVAKAIFPVPTNGTRGTATYEVTWAGLPQSIAASLFAFIGGLTVAELKFEKSSRGYADISKYRAIAFTRTDAGAVNATITVNYDVGPAVPRSIVGFISASAGRAQPPTVGGVQAQYEASIASVYLQGPLGDMEMPLPALGDAQNSLTLTVISDAASTSQYIVYY